MDMNELRAHIANTESVIIRSLSITEDTYVAGDALVQFGFTWGTFPYSYTTRINGYQNMFSDDIYKVLNGIETGVENFVRAIACEMDVATYFWAGQDLSFADEEAWDVANLLNETFRGIRVKAYDTLNREERTVRLSDIVVATGFNHSGRIYLATLFESKPRESYHYNGSTVYDTTALPKTFIRGAHSLVTALAQTIISQ